MISNQCVSGQSGEISRYFKNTYKSNIDSYAIALFPLNLSLCLAFKLTKTTAQKVSFSLMMFLLNANCSRQNCKFVKTYKISN